MARSRNVFAKLRLSRAVFSTTKFTPHLDLGVTTKFHPFLVFTHKIEKRNISDRGDEMDSTDHAGWYERPNGALLVL